MTDATERRERFLSACLETGAPADKALAQALAMEHFVVNGIVAPLMLMPPEPEPAGPVHEPLAADPSSAPEAGSAKTEDAPPPRQSPYKKDGRGTRWTAERIAEFKEMWLADVDISDIGAKFNLTKLSAYTRGKALGLKRRRRWGAKGAITSAPAAKAPSQKIAHRKAWTPAKLADFKEMWQADADVLEIALEFNVSKPSVYQRAKKMGLERRRAPGKRRTATPAQAPAPDRPDAPPAVATPATPQRGRPTTWADEKVARFKELWESGVRAEWIAEKLETSKGAVYSRANSMGLSRRSPGGTSPLPWASREPDSEPEPDAPVKAEPAAPPCPPLPDTSGLPRAPRPNGPEQTDIEGVMRFLMSRDIHVEKDANSIKRPRWLVEGRRDQALTATELISYANRERRRIGQPQLVYGL